MTAKEKYTAIMNALQNDCVVTVSTMTTTRALYFRTLKKFMEAGVPLMKVSDNSLYLARGKHYDCIDYCKIQVWEPGTRF